MMTEFKVGKGEGGRNLMGGAFLWTQTRNPFLSSGNAATVKATVLNERLHMDTTYTPSDIVGHHAVYRPLYKQRLEWMKPREQ